MTKQEVFLLHYYTSPDYLIKLRDTWGALIAHVEKSLREFESNLPPNYRARALPQQPDIVWGGRVLPNFRDTYHALCEGCVLLLAGDVQGLRACHGPLSDFKGQTDFDPSWMSAVDLDRYGDLLGESVQIASNISHTEGANWDPFDLSTEYDMSSRGPLPPQVDCHIYQVCRHKTVASGNMPEFSGVYVPDVEASCPQFLVNYRPAPLANVFLRYDDLLHPETGEKYGEEKITGRRHCTWTLVELQDAIGAHDSADFPEHAGLRVEGGSVCPISGFYVTPARIGSRAYFKAGTVMPSFSAEFGLVIWQWDVDQG